MVEGDKSVRQVRMARINDIVLLDHPPDAAGPRSINCYLVEAQDFTAAAPTGEGKKFKIDPQRLLYSLQWLHNSSPPDFHLQLVRRARSGAHLKLPAVPRKIVKSKGINRLDV
jgi:predicted DNA-binding transcriptional regulator YafY